jgi:hypothetical protein
MIGCMADSAWGLTIHSSRPPGLCLAQPTAAGRRRLNSGVRRQMSDLPTEALQHFRQLTDLQSTLGANAAILEHKYILLLMGSFSITVGNAHNRLRFEWDGREFFLNVKNCTCARQSSAQIWSQVENLRLAPPASVWSVIQQYCSQAFGA